MEEEPKWKKVPRISRSIPFGYEVCPEDDKVLLPIPLELEALELARTHIRSFSYRKVAEWLESVTGRRISHAGLKKRLKSELSRKRRSAAFKSWASRYEKAEQKAAEIDQGRIGAKG